jgi:hypothetical protein
MISVPPIASSMNVSKSAPQASCRRSSTQTPASALGHEPTASQNAIRGNTVPCLKCRQPPTVLVTAA